LNELETNKGLKGNEILQAETAQEVRSLIGAGRKNLIINGDMRVSQRGSWTTATAIINMAYTLDRWQTGIAGTGAASTLQDLTGSVKLIATAAFTGQTRIMYNFENSGLYSRISNKTLTLSAWVKSNTPNARISLWQGAWKGFTVNHSGSGEWENISVTKTIGDISGLYNGNLIMHAGLDGFNSADVAISIGDYIEVKEVQLELGSVATDFEHRSYGEELALCQRYYEKYSGRIDMHGQYASDSTGPHADARIVAIKFNQTKRDTPTMTIAGSQTPTAGYIYPDSFAASATVATATVTSTVTEYTADAEL
jgi:hypothetical protein